jgi:hypothetical protein
MNPKKHYTQIAVPLRRMFLAAFAAGVMFPLLVPSKTFATDYTGTFGANGIARTLNNGDTVTVTGSTDFLLYAGSGGSITVDGSFTGISTASYSSVRVAGPESWINLGSGSSIDTAHGMVLFASLGGAITADNITLTVGSVERPAVTTGILNEGSTIDLKNDSHLIFHADGASLHAIGISGNGSLLKATDGLHIEMSGTNKLASYTINADSQSRVELGTNAVIQGGDANGLLAGNAGHIIAGDGAEVVAGRTALLVWAGGHIEATKSAFTATGTEAGDGIAILARGGTIDIADSNIAGANHAILLSDLSSLAGQTNTITISGGELRSTAGALIGQELRILEAAEPISANTILLTGGAQATSDSGILFEGAAAMEADTSVYVIIDGAKTHVSGRFIDGASTASLAVGNGATWASVGSSEMDNLLLDGAIVRLTLDDLDFDNTIMVNDTLAVRTETGAASTVFVDLSDKLLAEIAGGDGDGGDGTGTAVINVYDLITGSQAFVEQENLIYTILDKNATGSTYTVTPLTGGEYKISGIVLLAAVPEPATCAVLAGLVLLVYAVIRRRM